MTDKYKALREALEQYKDPATEQWTVEEDYCDCEYPCLHKPFAIGLSHIAAEDFLDQWRYVAAANPAVITELLAERDQFAEEKAWIDHQPDDQERLYELIRADAVRSYQRHKSRIGGQQTVRGDSFEDHVMFSALHHAREQMANIAEERDRIKAAIEQVIEENLHLADGDVCTLIKLKQAIGMK